MDKLRKDIPDYILMPFSIPESSLPTLIDASPRGGYADGQDRRRARREKERQNKKNNAK